MNIKQPCFVLICSFFLIFSTSCRGKVECSQHSVDDAAWADDTSPDLQHLNTPFSDEPFTLDSNTIHRLLELNHFTVDEGQDEVLFGLRGCSIIDENAGEYTASTTLVETTPNHQDYKDVLGVWKRSTGEITVFPGSTVPNWWYMCVQTEQGGHQANMLPTGKYLYKVGPHRKVEGAFRSLQEVIVLRSNDDLVYETTDYWEKWVPIDNIHPGGCPDGMFSSAGCQTIPGTFGSGCEDYYPAQEDVHLGPWADFRASAGLDPEDNHDKWGETYVYLLLNCRDAHIISQNSELDGFQRLRFGSSGSAVRELQTALVDLGYSDVPIDGILGPNTAIAYIQWQQLNYGGEADGIVTPETAKQLGFTLE